MCASQDIYISIYLLCKVFFFINSEITATTRPPWRVYFSVVVQLVASTSACYSQSWNTCMLLIDHVPLCCVVGNYSNLEGDTRKGKFDSDLFIWFVTISLVCQN